MVSFARLKLEPTAMRLARQKFSADQRGVAAIEFAVVALPFFLMVFGIIGIGLHFFATNVIEHAVETVGRQIRTGQAQNAQLTNEEFKQSICNEAISSIDCSKLRVHVQSGAEWSDIEPVNCLAPGGGLAESAGQADAAVSASSGGGSTAVLVVACYEWDMAKAMPFLQLGTDALGGAALIQGSTAFRSEPFEQQQ